MKRYAYFSSENNEIEYTNDIKELIKYFYKILDKNLEPDKLYENFYDNINNDGYYIVKIIDDDIIYFYLDLEKKDKIYDDLKDEKEVIEILKNKIS